MDSLRWTRLVFAAAVLASCGDNPEPRENDAPHACVGASLRVDVLCDLDGDALAAAIEAALPTLTCDHRLVLDIVECIEADDPDGCGFDDRATAEALEGDFRTAFSAFDGCYDDYAFEVVDECYCRVY